MELAIKLRGIVHGQGWKYSSLITGNDDKWNVEILSANRIDNLLFRKGLIATLPYERTSMRRCGVHARRMGEVHGASCVFVGPVFKPPGGVANLRIEVRS